MVSLRVGNGTAIEVKNGTVKLNGPVVILEDNNAKDTNAKVVVAYCLKQGETLRRIGEEAKYVVEF